MTTALSPGAMASSSGRAPDSSSPRSGHSKPLVYIAAPFTQGDQLFNVHRACRCWRRLHDTGLVTPICPHWSTTQHLIDPMPTADWYAYDLEVMARCDAVLRLPGPSTGADIEVDIARSRGLVVFQDERELIAWAEVRRTAPTPGGDA